MRYAVRERERKKGKEKKGKGKAREKGNGELGEMDMTTEKWIGTEGNG